MTTTLPHTRSAPQYVKVRFEACDEFSPADESPQCGACGWLDEEHTATR